MRIADINQSMLNRTKCPEKMSDETSFEQVVTVTADYRQLLQSKQALNPTQLKVVSLQPFPDSFDKSSLSKAEISLTCVSG